jgi:hypothetical protein
MVVGLVLLVFALRSGLQTRSFVLTAQSAEGTVTKLNTGGSHPEIQFTTPNNVRISYPQGGLIFGFQPGDKVRVLFDGANPSGTATVDSLGAVWFVTLMLSGLGAASLVAGTFAWLSSAAGG